MSEIFSLRHLTRIREENLIGIEIQFLFIRCPSYLGSVADLRRAAGDSRVKASLALLFWKVCAFLKNESQMKRFLGSLG